MTCKSNIFLDIVGCDPVTLFGYCVFNNIVGYTFIFYFPLDFR
jgi:hypothetical protein